MHTIKLFQVLLHNDQSLTCHLIAWYLGLIDTDRIISGPTTPGQSGPGINSNEGVLLNPQISKARASP